MRLAKRKRDVRIQFFVTQDEKEFIVKNASLMQTKNIGAYLRKMAIDGQVIVKDYSVLKNVTAEINKIGVNINQISKRINSTGNAYENDMNEIKEQLEKIWQLQKSILLSQL